LVLNMAAANKRLSLGLPAAISAGRTKVVTSRRLAFSITLAARAVLSSSYRGDKGQLSEEI